MTRRGRHQELADQQTTLVLVPRGGRSTRTDGGNSAGWNAFVFRANGGTLSLLGERVLDTVTADLAGWLGTWHPARAIVVLPPSSTVCRTCTLPAVKGDQLASALRLQAETAFMGGIPGHRVSMAAVPESLGGSAGGRQGVIIGWPESAPVPTVPSLPDYVAVTYTSTLATLLGLLGDTPLSEPVIRADRQDRTVLFVLRGPNGLVLRSTLEDADDDGVWRDGVLRAAAETLLSNDASPDEIASVRASIENHLRGTASTAESTFLTLPAAVRDAVVRRLPASGFDAQRALALGAMLASGKGTAGSAESSLVGDLTRMQVSLPKPKPQPIQLALERLQSPRIAGIVIAASIATFILSPLVFAVVRNGILRLKIDDVASYERENRLIRQKAALYGTLSRTTWPMTKLLGDLSNAFPDTIEVESIQINANQGITIRGIAKPTEKPTHMESRDVALSFEERARDTGIFTEFQWDIDADDGRGSGFTVVCNVKNPVKQYAWKAETDNAVKTRRDRLYPNWQDIEKGGGGAASGAASASAGHADDAEHAAAPAGEHAEGDGKARPEPPKSTRVAGARPHDRPSDVKPGDVKPDPKHDAAKGEDEDPTDVKVVKSEDEEQPKDGEKSGEKPGEKVGAASDRGINRRHTEQPGGAKPATPQPSAPKVDAPPPFTDEELNAMSLAEAKEFLGKIGVARNSASLDADTSKRLEKDFYRVLERLKELQKQKAGS